MSIDPFGALRGAVDRLFDDYPLLSEWPWQIAAPAFPALNVWDDDENVYVEAEIPGVKASDLEVTAVGKELTVRGRREPLDEKGLTYQRQERGTGEFSRVISLPVEIEPDKIQAHLKEGVLTVRLPKSDRIRARRIEIRSS